MGFVVDKGKMKGKKVCIIAVGAADPALVERSVETIKLFCKCQRMDVVATMKGKAYAAGEDKIREAERLGRLL